jgi:effector-binding domain-containing protein
MKAALRSFFVIAAVALWSCGSEPKAGRDDAGASIADTKQFANNLRSISPTPGVVGLYDVPEMLCLSIMDSGSVSQLQAKIQQCYTRIEEDIVSTGSQRNGPYGQISYSNDTSNFKFECFALIRELPKTQPKWSRLVVLEADHMLLYNYYGPYQMLYAGYGELGQFAEKENLRQSGPLREYYYTSPLLEKDPSKLRTILMMPVRKQDS